MRCFICGAAGSLENFVMVADSSGKKHHLCPSCREEEEAERLAQQEGKENMRYIEALETYNGNETSLFLAGGITDCPDWQREMVEMLRHTDLVVLNPRRAHFLPHEHAAREQITWEYHHLRQASAISFWFPKETLCPIVLYELGAWSMTSKKLFVGVHPEYQRLQDVQIQTALARPDVQLVTSLEDLAQEVALWAEKR